MQRRRPEELCVPDKSFVLLATGRHQVRVEMNINKSNSLWKGIFTFHNNGIAFTFDEETLGYKSIIFVFRRKDMLKVVK